MYNAPSMPPEALSRAQAGREQGGVAVCADVEEAQAAPCPRAERLEGRRVGPENGQLLEARPAPRRRRARGGGGDRKVHHQLGRRLADRVAELRVHEPQHYGDRVSQIHPKSIPLPWD